MSSECDLGKCPGHIHRSSLPPDVLSESEITAPVISYLIFTQCCLIIIALFLVYKIMQGAVKEKGGYYLLLLSLMAQMHAHLFSSYSTNI